MPQKKTSINHLAPYNILDYRHLTQRTPLTLQHNLWMLQVNHFKSTLKMGLKNFIYLISYNQLLAEIINGVFCAAYCKIQNPRFRLSCNKDQVIFQVQNSLDERINLSLIFSVDRKTMELPEHQVIHTASIPVLLNLKVSISNGENSWSWYIILIFSSPHNSSSQILL